MRLGTMALLFVVLSGRTETHRASISGLMIHDLGIATERTLSRFPLSSDRGFSSAAKHICTDLQS
jgi:hypothetical protein